MSDSSEAPQPDSDSNAVGATPTVRLREETAELHREVEQSIDWSYYLRDAHRYAKFLRQISTFLPAADQKIDQLLGKPEPWFKDRRKGKWALEDLQLLTDQSETEILHKIADSAKSITGMSYAWVQTPQDAAGVLYVLEGSTMGAMHLCKSVSRNIPFAPVGYLAAYGDQTPSRWKTTKAWLDQFLVEPHHVGQAVQAAKQMFLFYREQLGGPS
ncbi:biliverdin-producing heme oxygenase [Bremerella cremea]|uniref:biliverdin-producing heme oxygenase n=1 Tax=Bremerella cremea TaxID=1031537 RepID=UPI0031ECB645